MRIDVRALAVTLGVIWGGAFFVAGVAHLLWPPYAQAFLDMIASIYPGYQVGGFGTVVVGTLYALVDGAFCGAIVAAVYNTLVRAPNTAA